jgi:hypothetical protein
MQALNVYKALAYLQKGASLDRNQYTSAIKAALWYLDAEDKTARVKKRKRGFRDLETAETSLQRARDAAAGAGPNFNPQRFEMLESQIETLRGEEKDSNTHLPSRQWIKDELSGYLRQGDWMLLQATIGGYGEFVAGQPSQKEGLLVTTANLLRQACKDLEKKGSEFPGQEIFVGHVEQAFEPTFVVVIGRKQARSRDEGKSPVASQARPDFDQIASRFKDGFNERVRQLFFDRSDAPLPVRIKTRILSSDDADMRYMDLNELLDTLGRQWP